MRRPGGSRFDVASLEGRVVVWDWLEQCEVVAWVRPDPCPSGWATETWCVATEVAWLENLLAAPCAERAR